MTAVESPDVLTGSWVKTSPEGLRRFVGLDGPHYCVKCGDNVPVLSPERLCAYCEKGKTVPIPDYCLKVAQLLAVTENHPDPVVRGVRKILTQAAVALDVAHKTPKVSPIVGVQRPSKPTTAERLARLGVTGPEVRAWAAGHGFEDVPRIGLLANKYLDAYEQAHA